MMKRFLASMVLMVLLFPSLALGEEVTMDDLVVTNGLYYKKFTDVPFDGEVVGRGRIEDGKKEGSWVSYDRDGRVSERAIYENGTLKDRPVEYEYFSSGQSGFKGTYKDGKEEGPWVYYHDNGQLWFKGTYKNGKKEGSWVLYFNNGQLREKGTYKDGKEEGPWVYYHDNGQLWVRATYKNGKSDGYWESYDENGQLKSKNTYKNGKLVK